MRFRISLFTSLFTIGLFALPHFVQASVPFFDSIIPLNYNLCPFGWGMLIVVAQNIINFSITIAIVFVAPLMIAYSGFLYVVNPTNPSGVSKAHGIFRTTVIGIIIAISAWAIVASLMSAITGSSSWSSIIHGTKECLQQKGSLETDGLNQANLITGVSANGAVVAVNGKSNAQCSSSNTACSPAALQSAGLSASQANVMSCIAVTESSGVPSTPPYNVTHPGSSSSACGTFQITKTTWNKYASGTCSDFSNCMNAACNIQVTQALVSNNGFSDWTCTGCNSKAASCVQQYNGG